MARLEASAPLFSGPNWDYGSLRQTYDAIERIALDELGLDVYPVQVEVITSEQMLDAYASVGLPLMYRHWSFGKRFAFHETLYRKGLQGLAYEIVINSNPCICYIMEENSMTMQTLVMAHAAFGHNHFFKNNYLFRQWTDANGILDYLSFARDYVAKCEERHGVEAVERVLDAAHALKDHGVNRYAHRTKPNLAEERRRAEEWQAHAEATYNDLWRTVPAPGSDKEDPDAAEARLQEIKRELGLPEENLLYFIEKRAPRLEDWQRELIRIVRLIAQYFYPQKQTQMMNEGCATFVHYEIMRRLHDKGLITEGSMLEFLHSHSSVVFQPDFDDPRFSGINPYALGFAMMSDIQRICEEPTEEDRAWFPDIAGKRRRLRRAAPRLGQLPRRELRAAVSEPGDDPPVPAVPGLRRQLQAGAAGRGDPRRDRLSQDPQRAVAAIRFVAARARHPGRRCRSARRPLPNSRALCA